MFQFPASPAIGQQFAPTAGVTYQWNGTGWVLLGLTTASLYPAGVVLPYAGNNPLPFQGWLPCDGRSYPTATYPLLFAVLGYNYGGAGPNFNVPDLRGRVPAGADDAGTPAGAAGRLTLATVNNPGVGGVGGLEQVALAVNQLAQHNHGVPPVAHNHVVADPGHTHGITDPGHPHGVTDPTHLHAQAALTLLNNAAGVLTGGATPTYGTGGSTAPVATGVTVNAAATGVSVIGAGSNVTTQAAGTGIATTDLQGADLPHLNVQPTLTLNYIIKT